MFEKLTVHEGSMGALRGLMLFRCRRAVVAAACAMAVVPTVAAQSRTAVLEGRVVDPSGGVIAGAQVAVRDPAPTLFFCLVG